MSDDKLTPGMMRLALDRAKGMPIFSKFVIPPAAVEQYEAWGMKEGKDFIVVQPLSESLD